MNIVFLSYYSGIVFRGVETFVDALATRLAHKHSTTVIMGGKPLSAKNYRQSQIPVPTIKHTQDTSWQRKWFVDVMTRNIGMFSWKAMQYLDAISPDIVLATNGGWQTVLMKMWTKYRGKKLVISGQAGLGRDDRWNIAWRPDAYIALSQRHARWAQPQLHSTYMTIIPNGVDLDRFNPKTAGRQVALLRKKWKLAKQVVLCVAGGEKYKRVATTILAVAKIPQTSLIVLGGNSDTKKLGNRWLQDRYIQATVPHDIIPAVYSLADVFTLVSEPVEAFGISTVEALAMNKPVVVTDDELRHEIVGKTGCFVSDPSNSLAYAQKLKQAMDTVWHDRPRQQAQHFSWDMISLKYEQVFKTLLADSF